MKKKQKELDVQNFGEKKEKSAKPELSVKKTLEVKGKESKITATIKKAVKKVKSKKIIKRVKKPLSAARNVESGNLVKKRVVPKRAVMKTKVKGSTEELVTISKKDFEAYIDRIRKEERAKLASGKTSVRKGK